VRLRVANGGRKIEPEDAQQLLRPFKRLARGSGGLGLGLSIVQSVVLAHHGTIELETPDEGGLVVEITLPAVPTPAARRGTGAATPPVVAGQR
jgi:signal transduction histidine kinase